MYYILHEFLTVYNTVSECETHFRNLNFGINKHNLCAQSSEVEWESGFIKKETNNYILSVWNLSPRKIIASFKSFVLRKNHEF